MSSVNRALVVLLPAVVVAVCGAAVVSYIVLQCYKDQIRLRLDPLEEYRLRAEQPVDDHRSVVWLVGDSRAADWNPAFLESPEFQVINYGIGGQTTGQILARMRKYLSQGDMPGYVVLQLGVNDLRAIGLLGGAEAIAEQAFLNIRQIVDMCLDNGIGVIYTSIFPVGRIEWLRRFIWSPGTEQEIRRLNSRVEAYLQNWPAYFFDAHAELIGETPDRLDIRYERNFLHLNNDGYRHLSARLRPVIDRLIAR